MADLSPRHEVVIEDSSGNSATVTDNRLDVNAQLDSDLNVEQGKCYLATSTGLTTLNSSSNLDILFKTNAALDIHLKDMSVNMITNSSSGTAHFELYEGTTVSANGSSVSIYNCNRQSANVSAVTMFTGPTVTATGTKLLTYLVHKDWETYIAPSYTNPFTLKLKTNTNYLMRFVNGYNQALTTTWIITWEDL